MRQIHERLKKKGASSEKPAAELLTIADCDHGSSMGDKLDAFL